MSIQMVLGRSSLQQRFISAIAANDPLVARLPDSLRRVRSLETEGVGRNHIPFDRAAGN